MYQYRDYCLKRTIGACKPPVFHFYSSFAFAIATVVFCLFGCLRIPIEVRPEKLIVISSEPAKKVRTEQEKSGDQEVPMERKTRQPKKIVKRRFKQEKKLKLLFGINRKSVPPDSFATPERIKLSEQSKVEQPRHGGPPISLFLQDVPADVALRALAFLVKTNMVLSEKVSEKRLSLRLHLVPWRDVFASVMDMLNLHSWESRGVVHVTTHAEKKSLSAGQHITLPGSDELHAELFRLRHSDPTLMRKTLLSLFGGKNKENTLQVAVDVPTRSLIAKGKAKELAIVAAVIAKTDVPPKQILIEAYIVEAGEDFEYKLGARLGYKKREGSENFYLTGTAGGNLDGDGPLTLGDHRNLIVNAAVEAPVWGLGVLLDRRRLKLELTALEREGKTKIISSPKIYTLNNQEAMIFQGDEVPYVTVSDQGTRTEFKQAGIRLSVTPSIIDAEKMILDVAVSKDTVDKRISNPPISRREIRTRLLAKNNSVVIIGGIFFKTENDSHTYVPILGKIPIIGNLFGRKRHAKDTRELLVFIAPHIIP